MHALATQQPVDRLMPVVMTWPLPVLRKPRRIGPEFMQHHVTCFGGVLPSHMSYCEGRARSTRPECLPGLGDGVIEDGDDPVALRTCDHQRWRQYNGVAKVATTARAADDYAVAPRVIHHAFDAVGGHHLLGTTILDQFDTREQPLAAHVTDPRVVHERAQPVEEVGTVLGGAFGEPLLEEDLDVAVCHGGGNRVSP